MRCTRVLLPSAPFLAGLILLSCALVALPVAQAQERLVKYSQVRVYISSKDDILALSQAGLALDHIDYRVTYFDAVLNNQELAILRKTGRRYQILVDDLVAEYRQRPKMSRDEMKALEAQMREQYHSPSGFHYGSMSGYYTFSEVVADLDDMRAQFPNLISVRQSLGLALEGRDIWMVKISDNPDIDEDETEVLYTALHHAREPQSMATVMYFMWYMLENYGIDSTVTNLVNTRELYFVPVVNPDGYVYVEQQDPYWRKNRRNNGDGYYGVDLNRNYAYEWGYDDNGSSPYTWSETYRGTAAFSEPETQVMHDFAVSRQFVTAFNYHSFGDLLIFPWGYIPNFDTPDQATFLAFAQDMTQFNNYIYGHANQTVGYVVNGEANDWFYGEQIEKPKVFAFTPEVGPWFWPDISEIIPLAQENIYPNLVLATAGGTCPLITISPSTLPDGSLGVAYNQTVTASGGAGPYTYVLSSGSLPDGLSLNSGTGNISGTPTVEASFSFTITATDSMGCAGSQAYMIDITSSCDQFDDGVLDPNWTYLKLAWDETGGYLNGTPSGRKAIAIATPAFPGCQICDIQTGIRVPGGVDTRVWLLTHYNDKRNTMELLFKEATDKVVLKQRVNGSVVKKAKAPFTIDINVDYVVGLTFDGTQVGVTIDGTPVINLIPVGSPPSGSVGFQTKNGTGSFDYLCVN